MSQEPFFTTLKNRGQIKISGKDRKSFIQALISNDINLLNSQDSLYSCLLTPQGKFLYDFFITKSNQELILDCEGGARATALAKLLNMYKLCVDVNISASKNIPIYTIIGTSKYGDKDPRHEAIGYRSYIKPCDLPEKNFDEWDKLRISLTIPDGSRDMIVNKSTLLECNIDKLNGVSFDKGCYIGQEITARMHYRGLVKKHLCIVASNSSLPFMKKHEFCLPEKDLRLLSEYIVLDTLPSFGDIITANGKNIGEMRSSCGDIGIALVKI